MDSTVIVIGICIALGMLIWVAVPVFRARRIADGEELPPRDG